MEKRCMESVQGLSHDCSMTERAILSTGVPRLHPSVQRDEEPTSSIVATERSETHGTTLIQIIPRPDELVCDPRSDRDSTGVAMEIGSVTSSPEPMDDFASVARAHSAPCHLHIDPPSRSKMNENPVEATLRRTRQALAWLGRAFRNEVQAADAIQRQRGVVSEGITATDFAVARAPSRSVGSTTNEQQQCISSTDRVDEGSPPALVCNETDNSAR